MMRIAKACVILILSIVVARAYAGSFPLFTVGNSSSGTGFTQIYVEVSGGGSVPNTSTPTGQQGTGCTGTGTYSCVIYISNTAGSDSNTCTFASPCQTLAHGAAQLRNGKPDQLLLDCTDSSQASAWPATDDFFGSTNHAPNGFGGGTVTGSVGGIITGPTLISFYNPSGGTCTTRPMVLLTANQNSQISIPLTGSGYTYGSVAVIGIYFYAYTSDPTNASYNYINALDGTAALDSGFNTGTTITWLLFEDNKCLYEFACIEPQGAAINAAGTVYIRRNIMAHTYGMGGGNNFTGFAQCAFSEHTAAQTYDENFFAFCGWDPTLTAAQNVTVSGNTITWPISNYVFNALPFPNNGTVYFESTCGSASAGTGYNVINESGATFQVSATESGSAVSLSGCSTATMMWADPTSISRNHAVYADQLNSQATFSYNIMGFSNDLMNRPGGTDTGNFTTYSNNNLSFGAFTNCCGGIEPTIATISATYNIAQHASDSAVGGEGGHSITNGRFSDGGDVAGLGMNINNVNGNPSAWASGTTYAIGNIVLGSDSVLYWSLQGSNTGNNPTGGGNPTWWQSVSGPAGVSMTNNLFNLFGTSSSGSTGIGLSGNNAGDVSNVSFTNNYFILGQTNIGEDSDGGNNITVSWTCSDLTGSGCASGYPAPSTTDILAYDHATWGTTCGAQTGYGGGSSWKFNDNCWLDFESREENRQLQTWPSNLSACMIDKYIWSTGLGITFNCSES